MSVNTDKQPAKTDYLLQPRDSESKPFSFTNGQLAGKSQKMAYDSFGEYKDASTLHKACVVYATAYTETMLTRAKAEDPEIFALRGMSKAEMQAHLTHNMCLPYAKVHSKVFRETTAKINEKTYLNDDIRRLYNGGDKFHPYF